MTIKAQSQHGKPSLAKLESTGGPLTLTTVRYNCFAPPIKTFCPALEEQTSAAHYTLKFRSAGVPIVLSARVEPG
jgi:hypothetical protein